MRHGLPGRRSRARRRRSACACHARVTQSMPRNCRGFLRTDRRQTATSLAILKNDQFDQALRFAAETGVHTIRLSHVKEAFQDTRKQTYRKMSRWEKILDEATKQSEPISAADSAAANVGGFDRNICPNRGSRRCFPLRQNLFGTKDRWCRSYRDRTGR